MAESLTEVVQLPNDQDMVLRLGGDDPDRTRQIIVAMYGFLVKKPLNTRRTYRTGIRQFLDLTQWKAIESITPADAAMYKSWLVNSGYSNSTVCTRLAAVDGFFTFLTSAAGKKVLARNPFDFIDRKDVLPTPLASAHPVEWLDFDKMLKATPTDPIGIRDRAVLLFIAHTGRRRSETAQLLISDLDLSARPRQYRVKGQSFTLPDLVYEYMRAHWISADRLDKLRPDSAVFAPVKSCPLTIGMDPERPLHNDIIYKIAKRAAVRAGIDPTKIDAHSLRLVAAKDPDTTNARRQDIQHFLGNAWPTTAARYVTVLRDPAKAMAAELRGIREAAVVLAGPIVE